MNPRPDKQKSGEILLLVLAAAYLAGIIWINFHGAFWYQTDVYTYALEGKLMNEARTCFPNGWIFGNQYHVISSPNVSALFYGIVQDSVLSMAIASTLSSIIIMLSFYWCFRLRLGKISIAAGLLCMVGAVIFGRSASVYVSGLQVLHTMATFYAFYMVVILLSLGCWLRLREKERTPWGMLILLVPLHFAMGMQSLRELLVLVIPLVLMEGLYFLYRLSKGGTFKELIFHNASLAFVLCILIIEVAGHFHMKSLHVATTPIIGELQLDLSPGGLATNLWASIKNILRISGLALASDGLKYLPLSICAAIIASAIVWAVLHILRTKNDEPLARIILFSAISVLGVLAVGTFLMRTRDIYFFVYWLLAAASVCYVLDHVKSSLKEPFCLILLAIGVINFGFNFIPDFIDYQRNHNQLSSFTDKLVKDGVKVIYVDATPVFAASSHDRILSQSFWVDANLSSGYPLTVFPSDKYLPLFDDEHYQHSLICFSGHTLPFLQTASEEFKDSLMTKLVLYDEIRLGNRHFVLYKPLSRVIAPPSSHYGQMD